MYIKNINYILNLTSLSQISKNCYHTYYTYEKLKRYEYYHTEYLHCTKTKNTVIKLHSSNYLHCTKTIAKFVYPKMLSNYNHFHLHSYLT